MKTLRNYKGQATFGCYTIGIRENNGVDVFIDGKPFEGKVTGLIRNTIAPQVGFNIEDKWNLQMMGRKLVGFINDSAKSSKSSKDSAKVSAKTSKDSVKSSKDSAKTSKSSKTSKDSVKTSKDSAKVSVKTSKISKDSTKISKTSKDSAKTSRTSKKIIESKETKQVREWCEKMGLKKYEILPNNEIDAWGFVDLEGKVSGSLPEYIQFNHIHQSLPFFHADFNIANCNLKTLRGCPRYVEGNLYIQNNKLTSLSYAPTHVGRSFICYGNPTEFTNADVKNVCDTTWISVRKASFLSSDDKPAKTRRSKKEKE